MEMERPTLVPAPRERGEEIVLVASFFTLAVVLTGPLTCGVAVYLAQWLIRHHKSARSYLALSVLALAGAVLLSVLAPLLTTNYHQLVTTIVSDRAFSVEVIVGFMLPVWLWTVPSAPTLVLLWELWDKLRPKSLEEQNRELQRKIIEAERQRGEQAQRRSQDDPDSERLQLGMHLAGERFDQEETGVTVEGEVVTFNERLLNLGMFILGVPNAGKSETLLRLMYEVLNKTERDVFFIDGKGESGMVEAFRTMAYNARDGVRGDVPIFRLGQSKKKGSAIYHGFAGEVDAIYNRLVKMAGVEEASGEARIYGNRERNLLKLICTVPEGPPRSFEEVIARLDIDYLTRAHAHNPISKPLLARLKKEDLHGLLDNIMPTVSDLYTVVGPEGFSFGTTRAAAFSLRATSIEDTAKRFLQFLIEDLKDYAGNEERQTRPALVVIDEFGQFGNENIIKLLQTARSAQIGIVLATQTVASLGAPEIRDNILENTGTQLLMRTPKPEPVADLAGTVQRIESSLQHQEGLPTQIGSAHLEDQYKVDLNKVRALWPGQGFLIRMGHACKLSVRRVTLDKLPAPPAQVVTPRAIAPEPPSVPKAPSPQPLSSDEEFQL